MVCKWGAACSSSRTTDGYYRCFYLFQEVAEKEIAALPRDTCPARIRNRCVLTSRPRAVVWRWRLSRIVFRHLADHAQLSGVQRAMWWATTNKAFLQKRQNWVLFQLLGWIKDTFYNLQHVRSGGGDRPIGRRPLARRGQPCLILSNLPHLLLLYI